MRRKIAAVAVIAAATLALTACGPTLEQRIEKREACHAAGGVYSEYRAELGSTVTRCDLSDEGSKR